MDSNNKSASNDDYLLREWLVRQRLPMSGIKELYDKIRSLPDDEKKLYQKFYIYGNHEETIEKIRFILGKSLS